METLLLKFLIHSTFVLVLMLLIVIQECPTPSCRNYRWWMCAMVCVINVDWVLKIFLLKSTGACGMVWFVVVLFHDHVFFFFLLNYVFLLTPWDLIFLLLFSHYFLFWHICKLQFGLKLESICGWPLFNVIWVFVLYM